MKCPACGKLRLFFQRHHKFHNVAWARKLYGKLMDHPLNIQLVCADCNVSHAGTGLIHWDEYQFCEALGIKPRSKSSNVGLNFRVQTEIVCRRLGFNKKRRGKEVSDCVVVLSGYETSKGTLAEIKRAEELGIPVFYDIEKFIEEYTKKDVSD